MGEGTIEIEGRGIAVSNLGKVLFPCGLTKGNLIDYYRRIAPHVLPHCRDRALTMQRFPEGIAHDGFFQKQIPDYFPDWIARVELAKEGGTITQVIANDAATLVYLANQACITPHLALARADRPNHPDRIVIDLDPSGSDFAKVQEAASHIRRALDQRTIRSFVQTTGSRGLHIIIPLSRSKPFDEAREWVRAFATEVAAKDPKLMTLELRKSERGDRVFLDIGRNAYGQTSVAPFAVRARDHAPVATPLRWDEALASDMHPRKYTITNIFRRLSKVSDPWVEFFDPASAAKI